MVFANWQLITWRVRINCSVFALSEEIKRANGRKQSRHGYAIGVCDIIMTCLLLTTLCGLCDDLAVGGEEEIGCEVNSIQRKSVLTFLLLLLLLLLFLLWGITWLAFLYRISSLRRPRTITSFLSFLSSSPSSSSSSLSSSSFMHPMFGVFVSYFLIEKANNCGRIDVRRWISHMQRIGWFLIFIARSPAMVIVRSEGSRCQITHVTVCFAHHGTCTLCSEKIGGVEAKRVGKAECATPGSGRRIKSRFIPSCSRLKR